MPLFPHYTGNPLLAALFGGGLAGIGLALIYNAGSCTGGSDLVSGEQSYELDLTVPRLPVPGADHPLD